MNGTLATRLKEEVLSRGASLFGIADLDRIRSDTDLLHSRYDGYRRGISIGVALSPASLADIRDQPTQNYCSEYLKVNMLLDSLAEAVEKELASSGARAERIPASEVVDWERLRGHLPHKLIGRYAGHGWIGRSILLVNPDFGARVRYVTVLTDSPLEAGAPSGDTCGKCRRCLAACPAKAIADEPAGFNMGACFEQLGRFNEILGEPHYICGVCVSACKGKSTARASHGPNSDTAAG